MCIAGMKYPEIRAISPCFGLMESPPGVRSGIPDLSFTGPTHSPRTPTDRWQGWPQSQRRR